MKYLFALSAVVALVHSAVCPEDIQLQPDFQISRYLGLWNNHEHGKSNPFESNNCEQARYSLNDEGRLVVRNTQYNKTSDMIELAPGTADCVGARCSVEFFKGAPRADYRVL